MSRALPILLLAAGLFMVLTAFASAAPNAPAGDREVCAEVEAQVSTAPSVHKVSCWKKIGMGKLVPDCPQERAILAAHSATLPHPHAEAVPHTPAMRPGFSSIGFDPPPPKA